MKHIYTTFSTIGKILIFAAFVFTNVSFAYAQSNYYNYYNNDGSNQDGSGWSYRGRNNSDISALSPDPVMNIKIPILFGVATSNLRDTWGDARSNGRTHEGIDIFAPRGMPIISPTDAVVTNISSTVTGGNYVFTANPGGERYFYTHLDNFAAGLQEGTVLKAGDLIGYVGNTGNASGGAPHLHFSIYKDNVISNPFPRLTAEFTIEEKIASMTKILAALPSDQALTLARLFVTNNKAVLMDAKSRNIILPAIVEQALSESSTVVPPSVSSGGGSVSVVGAIVINRSMTIGARGDDVKLLQQFLISKNKGPAAQALLFATATGYFGPITQRALAEYQASVGISPAVGYLGPITRAHLMAGQ